MWGEKSSGCSFLHGFSLECDGVGVVDQSVQNNLVASCHPCLGAISKGVLEVVVGGYTASVDIGISVTYSRLSGIL